MANETTAAMAIREFFGFDAATMMKEWKSLNAEEKKWYGEECAKALGKTLKNG
jgi:hypothetical protein